MRRVKSTTLNHLQRMPLLQTSHGPAASSELNERIETVMPVIEQVLGEPDRSMSRSMIRNALEQAADAEIPGEWVWHDWLSAALQILGLRCRAIDCTIDQAVDIAADGAQIITHCDDNSWLAIVQTKRSRVLVLQADEDSASRWMTGRQLRTTLNSAQAERSIRCVVVESKLTASASSAEPT